MDDQCHSMLLLLVYQTFPYFIHAFNFHPLPPLSMYHSLLFFIYHSSLSYTISLLSSISLSFFAFLCNPHSYFIHSISLFSFSHSLSLFQPNWPSCPLPLSHTLLKSLPYIFSRLLPACLTHISFSMSLSSSLLPPPFVIVISVALSPQFLFPHSSFGPPNL